MKRRRRLTQVLLAWCALAVVTPIACRAASVADWRHDLDQIVADIRLTHPDPFTKVGELTFMRAAAALQDDLPELTEEQRMVRAMQLVALLGDGHTQLEPDNAAFSRWYPVRFYEFTDGYFITGVHRSVVELSGAQVLRIAGRPVAEVAGAARSLMGADNAFDRRERLFALSSAALMRGLGYAGPDDSLTLEVRLRNRRTATHVLQARRADNPLFAADDATFEWRFRAEMQGPPLGTYEDWLSAYQNLPYSKLREVDPTRPLQLTSRRLFVTRALPERDAYYIQLNAVGDPPAEGFAAMFRRALGEMKARPVRRLILDWRYNFGGDGSKVPAMLREFVKHEDERPWQELYLLTGRRTFSAAIMALDAFTEQVPFSVVGEPSGAAVNHYGDATAKKYARAGVQLYVSTLWHQLDAYDPGEWFHVDVPAPFSFADYVAGRDPAVDAILRGEEMRSFGVIAMTDGGAAARRVLTERRQRFKHHEWWKPPHFQRIKRPGADLLRAGKAADAVEVFELLVELYPDEWNSWESLGRARLAAGLKKAGLEAYQCALAIDPDTFEDGDLRKAIAESGMTVEVPPQCPVQPFARPAVMRWGATAAELERALADGRLCTKQMRTRPIVPPFLDHVQDRQVQIDCDGFMFQGRPRWVEFVIGDDSLEMVWIMTTKEEEQALARTMIATYGAPTHRTKDYTAFATHRAALRYQPAEVLFYSERVAAEVEGFFKE